MKKKINLDISEDVDISEILVYRYDWKRDTSKPICDLIPVTGYPYQTFSGFTKFGFVFF